MEYNKQEIIQGVKLHSINTNKFKTNLIAVFLTTPLSREYVTYDAVLSATLRRGSKNLPTQEEIEAAKKRMEFTIDGINVKYAYNEGKSYVYKSSKQLSSEQIVQAIHNIGGNGMNMIQFRDAYEHYADYVYSSQCIIYKNSGTIYKVINGKPIRAN